MPGRVGWTWKEARAPHVPGSSTCRASHLEAFDERCHTPPRHGVECGSFQCLTALIWHFAHFVLRPLSHLDPGTGLGTAGAPSGVGGMFRVKSAVISV